MKVEMKIYKIMYYKILGSLLIGASIGGCTPELAPKVANSTVPIEFNSKVQGDSLNSANINWKEFFGDEYLASMIDTALKYNQELNLFMQEIKIAEAEVKARKGEYLPSVNAGLGAGFEKSGQYTRAGAVEENLEIRPGTEFPEPLPDYQLGLYASWELDVWKKLRNAKKASMMRYLSSIEGRNFLVTNLVAEIASTYYELIALDNELSIIQQNIVVQSQAMEIVKLQKAAARVTELAVKRFEAQVTGIKSLEFEVKQEIIETENRLHFLIGRYPGVVSRNSASFEALTTDSVLIGLPSDLLLNRPDIRKAELELQAANLDIKAARANFYPSFRITSGLGFQAFNPAYLLTTPESMMYSLAGDMVAPLVNRNAIKAVYQSASARQIQTVYDYERSILNAYLEVVSQSSKIENLGKSYELKAQQVDALITSVDISANLFRSARADYMEVLLTQREALEARFELIDLKMKQMEARVNIYRSLGGGWQ